MIAFAFSTVYYALIPQTLKTDALLVQLEQLERLRSEDTPSRLMITIESYWIPSQKKTK